MRLFISAIAFVFVSGSVAHAGLKPVSPAKVESYRALVLTSYESAIVAGLDCQGDYLKEAVDYIIRSAEVIAVDPSGAQPAFHFIAWFPAHDDELAERDEVWVTTTPDGKAVSAARMDGFQLTKTNVGTLVKPNIVSTWKAAGESNCH